jgi:tetratricopeptide (TPR) repeat protein
VNITRAHDPNPKLYDLVLGVCAGLWNFNILNKLLDPLNAPCLLNLQVRLYAQNLLHSSVQNAVFCHFEIKPNAMKNIVLSLLACLPLPLFAQNQDSIAVAKEVDSLLQVNRNLTIEQEFNEALKTVEFAKNKAAAAFGKNSLLYVSCLHSEGRTLYQMGQYADAESPYLEAMSIRERISGRENT